MIRHKLVGVPLLTLIVPLFGYSFSIPDSVLIQRLQANSKLYSKWERKLSLRELAIKGNKDISSDPVVYDTPLISTGTAAAKHDPNDDRRIKDAASHSDVIVIGVVTRNVAALTEHVGFVFTDSEVIVERVIGQAEPENGRAAISSGSEITVTSPGGLVVVDGHRISSFVPTIAPLKINSRYILFLKYIPASQSYKKVDLEGYDITNPTVLPLHKGVVNSLKEKMEDRDAVINAVVSSSAKVALNSREMR